MRLAASVLVSGDYDFRRSDLTTMDLGARAAQRAYEQAGVGPDDVNVVELHDAFASGGNHPRRGSGTLRPRGWRGAAALGATSLGGRIPVNPSGGLLSLGHALAASGVRVVAEVTQQLRGRSSDRQVPGARIGLARMLGGAASGLDGGAASVQIVIADDRL